MAIYRNSGSDSGVYSYEIGEDRILVTFTSGITYEYTNDITGSQHIKNMKSLAQLGQGLNSYINTHVKKKYSRKF